MLVFAVTSSLLGYAKRKSPVKCRTGQLWSHMVQRLATHMIMLKS